MRTILNLIDGQWVPSRDGRVFKDVNPADRRDVIAQVSRSSARDIDAAVRAAKRALPQWSQMPAPKRAMVLFRSARLLEERKEELAKAMVREMGKTLREAQGDVQEAIDTAYYFGGEGRRLFGHTVPSELPNKMCLTLRRPVGVCGLITPWNFPLAIPSWKVYPALICGNTIALKPAEDTPLLSALFGEILIESGLPKGVLNIVNGFGPEAGAALVRHPGTALISFTGSSAVGSWIASECGKRLKKCSLEMGGKNAQIVMDDADLDLAVKAGVWGAFATSGQRCTATSRMIVHTKVYDRYLKLFRSEMDKLVLGNPVDIKTDVGPLINRSQLDRVERYIKIGKKEGARLLKGGGRDVTGERKHGLYFKPALFTGVTPKMRIAQEEIFGPVTAFIRVKDFDEAIRVVNNSFYGLSSSIFTRDVVKAVRALHEIEAGITYINASTIGAEAHLPFGGVKRTGNGHREAGLMALDIFSEWKTVFVDYSGRLQKAQID
jgi:aldehyde dehydrogenase (NAD+)